jgi:hypothetical protein
MKHKLVMKIRKRRRIITQRLGRAWATTRLRSRRYVGVHPHEDFGDSLTGKTKKDGCLRLGYGNVNGIPAITTGNNKVNAIKRFVNHFELDGFFGAEGNLNWKAMSRAGRLPEQFLSTNALRTIASYNTHENFGRKQRGGTFGLAFGQLATQVSKVGTDESGMGRWSWILVTGRNGQKARIIVAYQACRNKATANGLVYQQQ